MFTDAFLNVVHLVLMTMKGSQSEDVQLKHWIIIILIAQLCFYMCGGFWMG